MFAQELQRYLKRQDMECKLERIKEGFINAVKVEHDDHHYGVEEVGLGWEVDGGGEDAAVDGGGEDVAVDGGGEDVAVDGGGEYEMEEVEVDEDEVEDVPSSGEEVEKAKDAKGAKGSGKARYVAPWGKQRSQSQRSKADWIVSTDKWGGCRYNSGWYWLRGAWYPYPGSCFQLSFQFLV